MEGSVTCKRGMRNSSRRSAGGLLYRDLGCPLMLGASRKSFIGMISRGEAPKDRLGGSLGAVLSAARRGVRLFRVHDVAETRQALAVWRAIEDSGC